MFGIIQQKSLPQIWTEVQEQKSTWEQKSFLTGEISKVQEQKSQDQKSGERKSFSLYQE